MKKKIKIIDILCSINCDEEVPKKIIYNNTIFTYDESVQDYYDKEENSLFEKGFTNIDTKTFLERDAAIFEDEFEELNKSDYQYSQCPSWNEKEEVIRIMNENFERHQKAIRDIINNQKKIIERLNNESNN